MSTTVNISILKSKLHTYKLGLVKAENKGNKEEAKKWKDGISSLEKQIQVCTAK